MLTFEFTGVEGRMTESEVLTSGMVGKQIQLVFDAGWAGLTKTVVFRAGEICRIADGSDDLVTVPEDVLLHPFRKLFVGVYGTDQAGTLVIPTIMAEGPMIRYGAAPTEDSTTEELPVWKKLQSQIGDLALLETGTKDSLVAAINELCLQVQLPCACGNGLSERAAALLVEILRHAVYEIDQSANINALELELLGNSDSGSDDVHTHSYSSAVTAAATCTTSGVRTYSCACGASYTEAIPATGHKYTSTITTPATCTTAGVKTYTCAVCGHSYTQTIPATGHSYSSVVTTPATCTAAGVKTYTCAVCGHSYTEEVAALGHSYESTVIAPSCASDGYTVHVCSRCFDRYETDIVAATGHNYEDGVCTHCGISDSADGDPTLEYIEAIYSGDEMPVGTDLDDLCPYLAVYEHYSTGESWSVADYTLSGTIAEGLNVITVSYRGLTTTFEVTGYVAATLNSISVTYSGDSVPAGTDVNTLTGIAVTAHYSDGTSETVTGYTLSGTISVGSNIITVTYLDKTAIFSVAGTATSGPALLYSWDFTQGITDSVGGVEMVLVGATQDSDGLHINAEGDRAYTMLDVTNQTVEVEFGEVTGENGGHGRIIAFGMSADTTAITYKAGFLWHSTGKWAFWKDSWNDGTNTDKLAIANGVVSMPVLTDTGFDITLNGEVIATSPSGLGGYKYLALGSHDSTYYTAIIKKLKIYEGV